MGTNGSKQGGEYSMLLKDFQIVRRVDQQGLLFLKNSKNGGEYLLREFTFNDKKQYEKTYQLLDRRKQQLSNCKFLVPLQKIITKTEDQYCATFYKMYALFQFTDRTLQNQISERQIHKRRFQQTELWSILASCILGLSHLQRNQIKHQSLRSNSILISREGVVKVYDPITTGCQTNYQTLASRRSTQHVYLSPSLTDGLHLQSNSPNHSPYKSDIFTLGMLILQAGLLQFQDQCYRDDCGRIHWQTVQYHIHRFRQSYSQDLTAFLELMLSKQERLRPDWVQLQQKVIKQQQVKTTSLLNLPIKSGRNSQQSYQPNKNIIINNPPSSLIKSQTSNYSQEPNFPRHTHLYQSKPSPQNYGLPSARSIEPRIACVAVSTIEFTRPQRSIFPNNTYTTTTKIDQNLIIVTQQQKISEADTPNDRNSSSYFDSSTKNIYEAGNYQPYQYSNGYVSSQGVFQRQVTTPIVNTYGSSTQVQIPKFNSNNHSTNKSQSKQSKNGQFVIERYKQGSEYKGYKLDGFRHGFGTFYYQDGGMYEGQWQYNKMQGKGKLFYQSGKMAYQGEWYNDQFSGKGILYNEYPDVLREPINYHNLDDIDQFWTKYEGEFKQDLKSGRGILFLSNGQYYDGEFLQDMANGKGTFYRMNGELIVGTWQRNIFIK